AILDVFVMLALFFPSRSRHTRFSRDWSSTCALPIFFLGAEFTQVYGRLRGSRVAESALLAEPEMTRAPATVETEEGIIMPQAIRSEERRVGKGDDCAGGAHGITRPNKAKDQTTDDSA